MDALPKLEDASNSNGRDFSNANASTPVSEEVFSKFFHDLINEDHLSSDSPIDLVGCCSHSQSNSYDVENVIPLPWLKMRSSDNTNHVSPSAQFQPAPSRSFSDTPNRPPLKKPALTAHETNKATLSSRQTIFTSLEEARQSVRRDNIQSDDTTLPSSPEEIRSCVTKLKKAFKSLHNATDSEGVKRSFKNSNYDERKVELLCWEILAAIVDRQVKGPFNSLHAKLPTSNFTRRFNDVEGVLYSSKSMCKHLMDPPYIHKVVDNPLKTFKGVVSNKKGNDKKSGQIKAGKKVSGV